VLLTRLGTPAQPLCDALDFAWGREVPTLFLVADKDSLLPLAGMHELLGKTPSSSKRMVVLGNSDHLHFCDNVERCTRCSGRCRRRARSRPRERCRPSTSSARAYEMVRGRGLAHMDAALKASEGAAKLLGGDLKALLAARGVDVSVH
jgi:hypothetical protein